MSIFNIFFKVCEGITLGYSILVIKLQVKFFLSKLNSIFDNNSDKKNFELHWVSFLTKNKNIILNLYLFYI